NEAVAIRKAFGAVEEVRAPTEGRNPALRPQVPERVEDEVGPVGREVVEVEQHEIEPVAAQVLPAALTGGADRFRRNLGGLFPACLVVVWRAELGDDDDIFTFAENLPEQLFGMAA